MSVAPFTLSGLSSWTLIEIGRRVQEATGSMLTLEHIILKTQKWFPLKIIHIQNMQLLYKQVKYYFAIYKL